MLSSEDAFSYAIARTEIGSYEGEHRLWVATKEDRNHMGSLKAKRSFDRE